MANENHTSGPVRTLPGTQHKPEDGAMCDDHEDILAVAKVQMDTDSFGAEYAYMCADCLALFVEEMKTGKSKDACDWCSRVEILSPVRDSGEGSCGPVYQVCKRCASEQVQRDKEEYDELFPQTVDHDDDDFYD